MGCSLAASLVASIKDFCRNMNLDFLFIEPSGMVVTDEMRSVASMGRRDVKYDIGPFITLVDGPAFPTVWEERRTLLVNQLTGADVVAISKVDLIEADRLEEIKQTLKDYCRDLTLLSVRSGSGVEEVLQTLVTS